MLGKALRFATECTLAFAICGNAVRIFGNAVPEEVASEFTGTTEAPHMECSSVRRAQLSTQYKLEDVDKDDRWHLIALVHGYRGKGMNMQWLAKGLCDAARGAKEKVVVAVLQANDQDKSVDSVMVQGDRAAEELLALVANSQEQGRIFVEYSLIGHSFGGLVARVIAQRVDSALPNLHPKLYASLFAPHAGLQSVVATKILPSLAWASGVNTSGLMDFLEQDADKSFLVQIAGGSYKNALAKFEKRVLYAGTSDWLVDFESAALTTEEEGELDTDTGYPVLQMRDVAKGVGVCSEHSVRCAVLRSLKDVSFERIAVDWSLMLPGKHRFKTMDFVEQQEIMRHIMSQFGKSLTLPRGSQCSKDCADGLECFNGVCRTNLFFPQTDCVDKGENPLCSTFLGQLNSILQGWHLIVTSSGGGGHVAAARNLKENLSTRLEIEFKDTLEMLAVRKDLMTSDAYLRSEAALVDAQSSKLPIEVLDVMSSQCTSLDGYGHLQMGGWMTEQWNGKQRVGDIQGLKKLVQMQPMTQLVFGYQCTKYLKLVLSGSEHHYRQPPQSLYSTQPLLLESIVSVASEQFDSTVDLFMTDLPTEEAAHFFDPLRRLAQATDASRLLVHTVPPVNGGGAEALERLSGLPASQFVLERFMPVNRAFTQPSGLPAPKERTIIELKPQFRIEREFLEQLGNPLVIEERDEVMLIMLGSQPTVAAMQQYASEILKLPPPEQGVRYAFLSCGKPSVPQYAELYSDIVSMTQATELKNVVLVPFTGQDAKVLLGRADVAVTRSGGMTAGELLALRSRAQDEKRVLLHVEPVDDTAATHALARYNSSEGDDEESLLAKVWQMAALNDGMVSWEAGNARYLIKALNAELVSPELIVPVLSGHGKKKYFEVQWDVLLTLRGFGKDAIAFSQAQAQGNVCSALQPAVCPRSYTAAPLHFEHISSSEQCTRALDAFENPEYIHSLSWIEVSMMPEGVLPNSHHCGHDAFVVRKLRSGSGMFAFFLGNSDLERAGKAAADACGAELLSCAEFIALRFSDAL